MAGLPPGDPQLVSMIVSHLKTQGLFDQFRRECLADVDTKPAYLNLKQRVDNFVSNHLSNHTWSPHLNKNQLRNNIRQLVLQSGMLEQGVDRIVAQVVDPKINHIFRPQVERVVREFLSPGSCSEEPPAPLVPIETKPDSSITEQASSSAPTITASSDAMSILDTINSLNQKANVKPSSEKLSDEPMELEESEQDMGVVEEGVCQLEDAEETKMTSELDVLEVKSEDAPELREVVVKEELVGEVKIEEEDEEEGSGDHEQKIDEKEKTTGKTGKSSEEKLDDDQLKSPNQAQQKVKERMKEEYSLEDSDLEGLSDITVSSVHTSDLSSFEGQSDDEQLLSDSSEEGELPPDDETTEKKRDTGEEDKESKPRRKAYVHKPFLYSRYYSDSDDEITVEERRRSAAKDKEERLLKRQQNRERMEEKRKQKAAQAEEQSHKKQKKRDPAGSEGPRAKEARKERKVLEKKMALNRRRKLDSRKEGDVSSKKKGDAVGEGSRKVELKLTASKTPQPKFIRNLSESAMSEERHRRTSGSISEDTSEPKKLCDKLLTHSFILDLEQGSQEALKQRSGKFDRPSRKELHIKERKEKERSLSDERAKVKQKQEKKPEHQADDILQKEGVKTSSEEKGEKKLKIKSEKKLTANTREGKLSSFEGVADEGPKEVKKIRTTSTEAGKAEKDKEKDKREKDKCKEKPKGEKTSAKSEFKPLQRPESAGSSEDRSDMDPGSEGSKKKHSKEVLKRSKSHSEDKQGERTKSKTDTKDTEKEKTKADQDSQKSAKSNFEIEKDPKRVKPTEKGATAEKAKSKSKEETKSLSDKKLQGSEVRSVAGAATSKPEMTKEKKRERNAKEQRKVSEEPSHEKSEVKSGKKKDKNPEKNNESQEERKEPTEEKLERSDKSSKSSVSSLSLDTEEVLKKPLLRDTSADSDPITTTVTTSFSDDTCDALSDITPEPPEGDADSQLCEVPAQADALLTLMDVCTAAEARLAPACFREDVSSDRALEDADMKMKEAALTLLSMDPDSTVASSFIIHSTMDDPGEDEAAAQPMQSPAAEEEQHPPVDVAAAAETEVTTMEASPAPPQHTAELVEETPNAAVGTENAEREMVETLKVDISETPAPQEPQNSLEEDESKKAEILPEAPLKDEPPPPAADKEAPEAVVFEQEKVKGTTEENPGCVASNITDKDSERSIVSGKDEQMEPDVSDTKMSPKTENMAEENLATTDNSEAESKKVEEELVPAMSEPHSIECSSVPDKNEETKIETNVPDKNEEISEAEADKQSVVKPIESVSSADSQEDEMGSELPEQEEKTEGKRKLKLSSQKSAVVNEEFTGDEKDEKGNNEQPSAEETEKTPVDEAKTTHRGRSPRTTEMSEKDQPETLDEPSSHRESHSGAAAKEDIADNQNEDEHKQVDNSSGEPAENEEQTNEESTKKSDERGSQISLPTPVKEDTEAAGISESENTADTPQPTVKKRSSDEMEETVEETPADKKAKDADIQEEQSEQPPQTDNCGLSSSSPSEEQENVKEETSIEKKLDDTEEGQQHGDQEATPKRVVRRGRPPKAAVAAAEDPDKKDKKLEKKESEQNDDEEEEDGEEEKETTTRATTRLASRLEAERNKPSKPSTRASRQSGKDETAAGARGTRGQAAAAKGGRKREASPPAVRTRGGQKSEEPPSKRAKR
ncbi:biorientation of chromosomes in cell division protein 1-like 1 isoform X2 [Betta splendens]|uniref:Biorientation of chromosomes in cell division protein 1-like 1 isoform X2 n=1 Tax=Betta splendens TaxID=158456 RepID=A0A6P7NTC7_BETSP|nr:biorientation of chromosomes in cell division protein 1-like 1 isoform X2 [Betta splendens]